ncbi:MAG: alcohol dehydrogenase catalytic domain-containing protein [Anaerolineae bacterium]|nr:alcohol dehydrogenase catalytic domain-containing protein [Candidatus Roseilinea sp.]MDW8451327.1 alcohol dehydrogenase catalytic domain-containing protein [Anaerolineae bacterium]
MKCLLYPAWDELEIAEQPMPVPAEGEVLVKVAAVGVCGSELEAFRHHNPRRTPPLIMGHEFCGEIVALHPSVSNAGWRAGDKVVCNALVPCGECVRCKRGDPHLCARRQIFGMHRPGAFAEYVNVPTRALIPWPAGMPAEHAALAEPLGNGVHMVNLVKDLRPGTVLVIGAGPIGLLAQQAFQALLGATTYAADLSDARLAVARRVGAAQVFNPRDVDVVQAVRDLTGGEGVDVVIDAVGAGVTKKQAVQAARPGGAAVWIGLHENTITAFDTYDVTLPEKRVFGTYAAKLEEMQTALDLVAAGKVDVSSWPEVFPLDRGVEAFRRMLAAQGNDIKAIIKP